jgi:deazaflavin-dependent oxidoreductase (nitroreductase family)
MNAEYQQKDQGFLTYPTGGWRRAMFKWPVQLWRLGLGPVMGHHMVLITQTGRKSGLPRRTMTELYRVNGRKYAPSGFGRRAQWYRNIEVDPRVTIQTADGVERMQAVRVVEDEELLVILEGIRGRSQAMYNLYLAALEIEPTAEDVLNKKDRIYWLRFDPTDEPTPPPLPADLVWLWPAAVVAVVLAWMLAKRK